MLRSPFPTLTGAPTKVTPDSGGDSGEERDIRLSLLAGKGFALVLQINSRPAPTTAHRPALTAQKPDLIGLFQSVTDERSHPRITIRIEVTTATSRLCYVTTDIFDIFKNLSSVQIDQPFIIRL